jgi:tartrate-resistant acid phosphatase type 5
MGALGVGASPYLLLLLLLLQALPVRVTGAPFALRPVAGYPKSLDFFILGDWGAHDSPGKDLVSAAMAQRAAQLHPGAAPGDASTSTFVVSTGDNFYLSSRFPYEGLANSTDPKFAAVWRDAYPGTSHLPWLGCLGNHDWYGDVQAQLDLTRTQDSWMIPALFWTTSMAIQPGPGQSSRTALNVAFVFVDTNLLYYGYEGDDRPEKARMKENFLHFGYGGVIWWVLC